jgi:Zn-dependent M28 family amino/carboxypeptidase
MEQAAEWVANRMKEIGYSPERQTYRIPGGHFAGEAADNLVAEIAGTSNPEEIVVIGAHYDSVYGSPGANDNASAVAALLALAEWFRDRPQPLTVRFVAFANEEPPFFHTRNMGSYAYANNSRELGEQIIAMMSMDGLGFYSDEPRSQHYPVPGLGLLYPKTADFIGFVTRLRDRSLLNRVLGAFRENATINSEGATLPAFIPGVFWSDHWSFEQFRYPALMITDTAPFRYPFYHTAEDTPDKLDYGRMARVVSGLEAVVSDLAESS